MSELKILLLESHLPSQKLLVEMLGTLNQNNVIIASNSIEDKVLIECEHFFDVLICGFSAEHSHELSFIRQANDLGRIHSLIIVSDAEQSIRQAIQKLAQLWGHHVTGTLSYPVCKSKLKAALASPGKRTSLATPFLIEVFPANEIESGIRNSQFTPYYQPKFDIGTMKIIGAEVLARWQHPTLGVITPAAFLETARHFDYLDEMMLDILKKSLGFLNAGKISEDFGLSINVDPVQLRNPDFHKHFKGTLADENISPNRITVEITEEGVIGSPANCLENLINLRLLGCGISIDDFGAGLSSLQRICELPCTEIKLDMSFARNLTSNEKSKAAIQNMVSLSNHIGTQLVVEGIEQEEQIILLRQLNCHVGQGYFFSPPIPGEKLSLLLARQSEQNLAEATINTACAVR